MPRTLIFILLMLSLHGCIRQDLSDCPDGNNLSLLFEYYGDGAHDIFRDKIENVELFIYRDDGVFERRLSVSQRELKSYRGVRLELVPGRYTVVVWGNVSGRSVFSNHQELDGHRISVSDVETADCLYYGSSTIDVQQSLTEEKIIFHSAHIRFDVHIKGFDTSPLNTVPGKLPIVEIFGPPAVYDQYMEATETALIRPEIFTANDSKTGNIYSAEFASFRFDDKNDVGLAVMDDSGEFVLTLRLEEFMAAHNITIAAVQEAVVGIYIKFNRESVEISVDTWDSNDVDPGLD